MLKAMVPYPPTDDIRCLRVWRTSTIRVPAPYDSLLLPTSVSHRAASSVYQASSSPASRRRESSACKPASWPCNPINFASQRCHFGGCGAPSWLRSSCAHSGQEGIRAAQRHRQRIMDSRMLAGSRAAQDFSELGSDTVSAPAFGRIEGGYQEVKQLRLRHAHFALSTPPCLHRRDIARAWHFR